MELSEHFRDKMREYIPPGGRVAQLYHGNSSDIMEELGRIVSNKGEVFGLDNDGFLHLTDVGENNFSKFKLLECVFPPFPKELSNLDGIVLRDFYLTFNSESDSNILSENPPLYLSINDSIKRGGYFLLNLNSIEEKLEREYYPLYRGTINRHFSMFRKEYDSGDTLVYQKIY